MGFCGQDHRKFGTCAQTWQRKEGDLQGCQVRLCRLLTELKSPRKVIFFSNSHKSLVGQVKAWKLKFIQQWELCCCLLWEAFSKTPQKELTIVPCSVRVLPVPGLDCMFGSTPPPRVYEPFEDMNYVFLLFSHSAMSNSLPPHGLQHIRLSYPSPSPGDS